MTTSPAPAWQPTCWVHKLEPCGPTVYDLGMRNCSTFAADALRAAGLKVPHGIGDTVPRYLFQNLHQSYDRAAPPAPVPRVFTAPQPRN